MCETNPAIEVLERISGASRDEFGEIARSVKANAAKLDACPKHDFQPLRGKRLRYKCAACGGDVDASAFHWYSQGRLHAALAVARLA